MHNETIQNDPLGEKAETIRLITTNLGVSPAVGD
jgi:hypothetical protein